MFSINFSMFCAEIRLEVSAYKFCWNLSTILILVGEGSISPRYCAVNLSPMFYRNEALFFFSLFFSLQLNFGRDTIQCGFWKNIVCSIFRVKQYCLLHLYFKKRLLIWLFMSSVRLSRGMELVPRRYYVLVIIVKTYIQHRWWIFQANFRLPWS